MPLYEVDGKRVATPADGEYWVAPNAWVFGDVVIAREASIWFGAVVRGDNEQISIGARTNIQDGAVLHTDPGYPMVIGEGVTVGHMALLHACTLEDLSFVGMKACVMDGATVETGGMVAAGALLTPGKRVRKGELWAGSPAKLMRTLTPTEAEMFQWTADHYVERARTYRQIEA